MSVEWFILLYDTQTKKFRPMRLLIARWAPTRNLHSILRSPTSATSGSLSFYPKEQLSSFFTPTTYAKIWRIRKAHAHGQIERNYRVYKSDRRKFRRRLLSIPYGGPMRCTSRGPHQLQALSLRPVGSQGVSRSAYGNRSRENSGWLGDGACVCVGRYKNQPKIVLTLLDAESFLSSHHRESREYSESADKEGSLTGE